MTELPPQNGKEPDQEKEPSIREIVKKHIEKFLALSDEPGPVLSDKEQFALSKKAGEDPKAMKQWHEHKHSSKYRRNALSIPLMAAGMFLDSSESAYIPEKEKSNLLQKTRTVEKHVIEVGALPFTKDDVQEVVDLANEIKTYL